MIRIETPGLAHTPLNQARVNPAAASNNGYGALAKGLADTSEAFSKIAGNIQKSEDAHALSSLRNLWSERNAQLAIDLKKEQDPQSHLDRSNQLLTDLRSELDAADLRPDVRNAALRDFDRFSSNSRIRTAEGAANLSISRAKMSLKNERQQAYQTGDGYQFTAALDQALESGIIPPEEYDAELNQWHSKQREDNIRRSIQKNPRSWLNDNADSDTGEPPLIQEKRRQFARSQVLKTTANYLNSIDDGIVQGFIENEEDIELLGKAQDIRPSVIDRAKNNLRRRTNEEQKNKLLDPKYQQQVVGEVQLLLSTYNTQELSEFDENYARMDDLIRQLPSGSAIRTELSRQLNNHRDGQTDTIKTNVDRAREIGKKLLKEGHFGQYDDTRTLGGLTKTSLLSPGYLLGYGFSEDQVKTIKKETSETKQLAKLRELSWKKEGENTLGDDYAIYYEDLQNAKPTATQYQTVSENTRRQTLKEYGRVFTEFENFIQDNKGKELTTEELESKFYQLTGKQTYSRAKATLLPPKQ